MAIKRTPTPRANANDSILLFWPRKRVAVINTDKAIDNPPPVGVGIV